MRTTAAVLAAIGLLALNPSPTHAASAPLPTVEGVPVLAQTLVGNVTDDREAVLSIHGVRRVEGGTVLYYSMGLVPEDRSGPAAFFSSYGNGNFTTLTQGTRGALVCAAAAIHVATSTAYTALLRGGAPNCIATAVVDFQVHADELGKAVVAYTVLAPVPASVTSVDVMVGTALLQGVPVGDGLLEPAVTEPAPVVGTGWPTVNLAAIGTAIKPEEAVFALRSRVTDLASSVTKAQGKSGKELDLDTSVLFATDKATLTSKATAVITEAAKQITAAGSGGSIVVTGHTDSNASDSYNLTLSNRRAQAVAKALKTQLRAGITITSVGKGESEPIADNSTKEGRALNRRVTITLPT